MTLFPKNLQIALRWVALAVLVLTAGCGSINTHLLGEPALYPTMRAYGQELAQDTSKHPPSKPPSEGRAAKNPRAWQGASPSEYHSGQASGPGYVFMVLDFPFSFVLDTLLLPWDVVRVVRQPEPRPRR